jgi:hypothetical protein
MPIVKVRRTIWSRGSACPRTIHRATPSAAIRLRGPGGPVQDLEDEHDGKEPDGDGEPSHGATTAMNQEHAWAPTDHFWASGEGEPSLAFTNIPTMLPRGYDSDRESDVADAPHDAEDDCEDTERSGDRPGVLAPCLDQRVENDSHKGIVHGHRVLGAIAREQRAMQRTATRLRKIDPREGESSAIPPVALKAVGELALALFKAPQDALW